MALIDKETIYSEIDARREHMAYELYGLEENTPEYQRVKGMHDAYVDMLTYLTYSLQEQPVEELEEEIDACWQNWLSPSNQKEVEGILPKTEFATYARHFAEWGADHLRDSTKMIPDELEKAAGEYASDSTGFIDMTAYRAFIAGAEWQKKQMLEKAVKDAMLLQQKRESYSLSILAGLVRNPSLIQMASIRESIKGDGFTHTFSVDLNPAVDAAVAAADALIDKLYPKTEP